MSAQTTVNWSVFEERQARKNSARVEKFYQVAARCGHTTMLRKSDANKSVAQNRICKACQLSERAAKGYRTTAQKYGADFAIKAVIKQQLANPSKPEQQISVWLDQLGVAYERQVVVNLENCRYIVDFMLADGKAIEGAGGYWHAKNKTDKDELLARAVMVLFVTDDLVMDSPAEALALITRYVNA